MNNNQDFNNLPNSPIPNSLTNMVPTVPNKPNQNTINNNSQTLEQNQNNLYLNQPNAITNNNQEQNISNNNIINQQQNKFINYNNSPSETSIADLNVEGSYNQLEKPSYANDPQVKQNMAEHKKNTVPISKELKTVIVIALILLIFIIIIPIIFEFINDIRFN